MNKSLDEIAAEMDSSLYEREEREGHHRPQHRFSPYPADHGPSWRAEKESGGGSIAGSGGGDATKVFAANLNYTVTWQKLKDHMKKGGWGLGYCSSSQVYVISLSLSLSLSLTHSWTSY